MIIDIIPKISFPDKFELEGNMKQLSFHSFDLAVAGVAYSEHFEVLQFFDVNYSSWDWLLIPPHLLVHIKHSLSEPISMSQEKRCNERVWSHPSHRVSELINQIWRPLSDHPRPIFLFRPGLLSKCQTCEGFGNSAAEYNTKKALKQKAIRLWRSRPTVIPRTVPMLIKSSVLRCFKTFMRWSVHSVWIMRREKWLNDATLNVLTRSYYLWLPSGYYLECSYSRVLDEDWESWNFGFKTTRCTVEYLYLTLHKVKYLPGFR